MKTRLILPVTERSSYHTERLSSMESPNAFQNCIRSAYGEIEYGFDTFRALPRIAKTIIPRISRHVAKDRPKSVALIFTGCGTSGRIGFLSSTYENDTFVRCEYVMAGGSKAVVFSNELPEDDPTLGVNDLKEKIKQLHVDRIVLVGISCGLSAPYVGGQILYGLRDDSVHAVVVVGFNPASLARDVNIEYLSNKKRKSFRSLLTEHEKKNVEKLFLLNPVIGPEPVTGSSRMKGGSATVILLNALKSSIVSHLQGNEDEEVISKSLEKSFQDVKRAFEPQFSVFEIMKRTAKALRDGGRVYYISDDPYAGMIGAIDFSEMPDTYGTAFDRMTAVISTDIDLPVPVTQSFKPNFSLDVVIRIDRDRSLTLMSSLDDDDTRIKTTCFTALALKIVLNTISTYAQSQGRYAIEGNVTIGVTAANDKIYDRCLRIIKSRGGTERTLLRAVYRVDDVEELLRRPRVEHIKAATPKHGEKCDVLQRALQSLRKTSSMPHNLVGVDLGGTWIRVVLDLMTKMIRDFVGSSNRHDNVHICVGQPGLVLSEDLVSNAANLGWNDPKPLGRTLRERFPRSLVSLLPDVDCAALAEAEFGAGKDISNGRVAIVNIGTGLGVGLVSKNATSRSRLLNPGAEFGHIIVKYDETSSCNCGSKGCLEMIANGRSDTKHGASIVLLNTIRAYVPDRIVLGGGIGTSLDLKALRESLRNICWKEEIGKYVEDCSVIVKAELEPGEAGVRGAMLLASHLRE